MSKDNGGPASDRELLEMAAKAAGIDLRWKLGAHQITLPPALPYYLVGGPDQYWNPLTDDGDALRLAVKLGLCILCHATQVEYSKRNGQVGTVAEQTFRNAAATRRAIVRAAAAIGSAM